MYSEVQVRNALKKIKPEDVDKFKFYMRAGASVVEISRKFKISYDYATILFLEFSVQEKRFQKALGNKTEPYYHKEKDYKIPEYKARDLKGQELKIYKSLENGKNERDLHGGNK